MAGCKTDRLECPSGLIKSLHANDADQPRTTPANVRDYFVAFLTNRPIARIETVATEIDCRTASRVGIWTVIPTAPATGATREVKARYLFFDRVQNGGWKIDHLHPSMMRLLGPMVVKLCHYTLSRSGADTASGKGRGGRSRARSR